MVRHGSEDRSTLNFRSGELVEVRSKEEILATLDQTGQLDSLPFMPEMLKYCGKQFRVYKSAHKTCDTINHSGGRRMAGAVHLEGLRCDGEAHGGCQAGCLLFFKEAWLKMAPGSASEPVLSSSRNTRSTAGCSGENLWRSVYRTKGLGEDAAGSASEAYSCQTTELFRATAPLKWWDMRQYVRDLVSRNVTLSQVMKAAIFRMFSALLKVGGYRVLVATYNQVQRLRGGMPYPVRAGKLKSKTPSLTLNLQAGELVRVKTHDEILETINENNRNRGLSFDVEMVKYCGKTARVLRRVERIINEKTGEMIRMPTDSIILDGVICGADFSHGRVFCPRSIYSYWREIWLERVDKGTPEAPCSSAIQKSQERPCESVRL